MHELHRNHGKTTENSFWRSRTYLVLTAFFAVIGLLLVFEHRALLFTGSGLLTGLLAVCVVMHLFMNSGHGGHGGGSDRS